MFDIWNHLAWFTILTVILYISYALDTNKCRTGNGKGETPVIIPYAAAVIIMMVGELIAWPIWYIFS